MLSHRSPPQLTICQGDMMIWFATRLLLSLTVVTTVFATVGCSNNVVPQGDLISPQTGSEFTEEQVAASPVAAKAGSIGFVSADSVRVRTSPDNGDNVAGRLFINDQVQVVDGNVIGKDGFIKIRILQSNSTVDRSMEVYIAQRFVNSAKLDVDAMATSGSIAAGAAAPRVQGQRPIQTNRLFIVTNIATERLRVYQRCNPGEGCVNRMIMEAGVVNGESKDGTRTNVGFFNVSSWTKFYETTPYPGWYKPGYPDVPKPGNRTAWFKSEYMPNGKGDMRGAFGWYTAKVAPNADGQWTHGTAGWGADKTDFIDFKDSFWGGLVGLFTSIRSHGCTRIDNESIAYIRQLIAVGTPLVKIYAQEVYRDESRASYSKVPGRWEYILTTRGAQAINNHQLADRQTVLSQGTPQSEWLDQGTFEIDQYPDAVSGDLYRIGGFQGQFIVDEGTLLNYRHPAGIGRGGFSDQVAPPYMYTTNAAVSAGRSSSRSYQHDRQNSYDYGGGGG